MSEITDMVASIRPESVLATIIDDYGGNFRPCDLGKAFGLEPQSKEAADASEALTRSIQALEQLEFVDWNVTNGNKLWHVTDKGRAAFDASTR
jgi:hypothetical protein